LALAGAGGLLAACGGGSTTSALTGSAGDSGGKPVRGGSLRIGAIGGSNTDTLDAHALLSNVDFARAPQLYNALAQINSKGKVELELAESFEPNKDATEWVIRIRDGVLTHDNKKFGAKDVLFSINRIVKGEYGGAVLFGPIDLNACKVIDPLTVKLKFSEPYSVLEEAVAYKMYAWMVPVGYDPNKPVGTGPFQLKSFTPGRESVTTRFDGYWDAPKPYLDEVRTIDIAEETAQVNALISGQVDAIDYLTAASVGTLESSGQKVVISKTGGYVPFWMATDAAPYSDNRVREALRLVVDRQQMIDSVFGGYGTVGNDIFSPYDKFYDKGLYPQREQDLEKAKSLLKSAGQEGLDLELITTPLSAGMTQLAQVFKTQAAAAGINTNVVTQPVTEWLDRSYAKAPFSQDNWSYLPYLVNANQATLSTSPYNVTHFNDPKYDRLYKEAVSTLDGSRQEELVQEMMGIDYKEGGLIIPLFIPVIDAVAPYVYGDESSVTAFSFNGFQFQNFWIKK
jgi:peptide/nickel transport system substrate-binding protein